MAGKEDTKKRVEFLTYDEVRNSNSDADVALMNDRKNRETLAAPDMAEPVSRAVKKEIITIVPEAMNPKGSKQYFEKVYYEESGEAEHIVDCNLRLRKIAVAISNRELIPEKTLFGNIFAMAFPRDQKMQTVMKVYAFDGSDDFAPLAEITYELMALGSLKNHESENLSYAERLNLIKALTEYLEDMTVQNPITKDVKSDLEVDYQKALDNVAQMDFEQEKLNGVIPTFKMGTEKIMIDDDIHLEKLKMNMLKYFYHKNRNRIVSQKVPVIQSPNLPKVSTSMLLKAVQVNLEMKKKYELIDAEIVKLRIMAINVTLIVNKQFDEIASFLLISEIFANDEIHNLEKYMDLFEIEEDVAWRLANKILKAKKEIKEIQLAENDIYSILGAYLMDVHATISPEILAGLVSKV